MKSSRIVRACSGVVGFLIVLCILIALNVVLSNFNLRLDVTEERLHTLSDGSRNLLGKLERDVTLKFFFNGSAAEVDVGLKNYARRVEDLLAEYELAAGGRIILEKHDPKPDSDAEDWARRYGVAGQAVGGMGFGGPVVYLGLVAVADDVHEVIPALDPRAESLLEYQMTRMISRLANPGQARVGVMSSLPVLGRPGSPYAMPGRPQTPPQPPWAVFSEISKDYEVVDVPVASTEIDPSLDTLLLVHPKKLSDPTLYAIDQFVLAGGGLVVFVDPMCMTELEMMGPTSPMGGPDVSSNLERLFAAWGVTFDTQHVVADMQSASLLRGPNNTTEESPVWLSLRGGRVNAFDVLTSRLEFLMLPFAGHVSAAATEDVTVSTLASTSRDAAPVAAMMARMGAEAVRHEFKSGDKRLDLIVRLFGKLKTAFPGGLPESGGAPPLSESRQESTVIIVGDVDMLYDRFCVRELDFLGFKTHQPMNDNLVFFANVVDQLAGGADLVGVRSRGKTDRPFKRVMDLEAKAKSRWRQEEQALQTTLEDAQRRLNELQSQKEQSQQYIVSPEQQKEVEKFLAQELETKKQLKKVRRSLREDIERLGMWVKLVNVMLMPLCVGLFGVGFWAVRRTRSRRR